MNKWTDTQLAAINDVGGSLLVSAAAGSGKTAVMVQRALQLISREENPIRAERILMLTFTNAAAQELRARIATGIEELLRQNPNNAALRGQRLMLKRAYIGTIDAFCQGLVRENFTQLGLRPDIMVGDDALMAQLAGEALENCMEEMYDDEDFARFAGLYGRARSDAQAAQLVAELYQFTRSLPAPWQYLENAVNMYNENILLMHSPWAAQLIQTANDALQEAQKLTQVAICAAQSAIECSPYLPALASDAAAIGEISGLLQAKNWDAAAALANGYTFPPLKPVRGEGQQKQLVGENRRKVRDILDDLQKNCFVCSESEYMQDIKAAKPMVAALVRAVRLYGEKYSQAKQSQQVLDFSDFEHLALALLQNSNGGRSALAGQVSARYDAVMVDEYQDTSRLQSALYQCLGNENGSNLFYVGDVKQSIYRFRKASPDIFLEKKQSWAPHGAGVYPAVIALLHNFRSAPGLVQGINYIFGQIMSKKLGEIDYTQSEQLVPAAQYTNPGGVNMYIVESDDDTAEPRWVAQRIAQMLAQGQLVQVGGQLRPCTCDDFCILLRARTKMPAFAAALKAQGIPAMADVAEELLQTPELLPLVAALRCIDNPGDDVSLAAAMLGPLFRFTPNEMLRLRAASPRGRLWGALGSATDEKTREFVSDITYYRALSGEISAGRLCEELVNHSGYLAAVAAMENGAARKENLQRFIAWANQLAAGGSGALAGFLWLLEAGKCPPPPGASSVPGQVSLLSIHKSKGLEYPICFLADTAHTFNRTDLTLRVQMHTQLGLGLTLRQGGSLFPSLPLLAIRSKAAAEGLSEEMRILYVALTRAQGQLVISLATKDARPLLAKAAAMAQMEDSSYALLNARSMGQWLLVAALRHPNAQALLQQYLGFYISAAAQASPLTLQVVAPAATAAAVKSAFSLTAQPNAQQLQQIKAAFTHSPARTALAAVPAKVSVSALAKSQDEILLQRPAFMQQKGLSAVEKGLAQHAYMQFASFAPAAKNPQRELQRLVDEGFITGGQADAVNLDGISAFFASALYARIGAATRVLREYDFMFALPAGQVQPQLPKNLADEAVLVQGIADLVLIKEQSIEIIDYKTDSGISLHQLVQRYQGQLNWYRLAIERRFKLPVTKLTLWAFAQGCEADVKIIAEQ